MKTKSIVFFLLLCVSTYASSFGSQSLKFEESIQQSCGIVFNTSSGISFQDEEPFKIGTFTLYSNDKGKKKVKLKIKSLSKSTNLQDLNSSIFYIVFDKTKRIKLNKMLENGTTLKKGIHQVHIEIDIERNKVLSGTARLQFEMETICK